MGPSRRRGKNASAALRIFVRHRKKIFATISAQSGSPRQVGDVRYSGMNRLEPAFRRPVQSTASKDSAGASLICADRPFPGYFRDGCVSRERSLRLQKSPTPNNRENAGNSRDISKGFSYL